MAIKIGAVLLFVVLSVLLPCYIPIVSSDWCGWACISGDHSSKCQWIQGLDGSFSWWCLGHVSSNPGGCLTFVEVAWCSRRSFCRPESCSGLSSWRLLAWACFWGGHSLGLAPMEVAIMGLVPWMLLTQAYSSSGNLLVLARTEVAGLSLLLQSLITCTCSCRQYLLRPALAEVSTYSLKREIQKALISVLGR